MLNGFDSGHRTKDRTDGDTQDLPKLGAEAGNDFAKNPVLRRWWLLRWAMDRSFEDALRLAAEAEAFLVGQRGASAEWFFESCRSTMSAKSCREAATNGDGPAKPSPTHAGNRPEPILVPHRKAELEARLTAGMTNGAVAAEFGLTPRQVQGFRMQIARKAGRQERVKPSERSVDPVGADAPLPLIDEVVRYLRQQGDSVTNSDQSTFLVNARFQLDFEQLLNRANRMRERQGKPPFGRSSRPAENYSSRPAEN